MATITIAGYAFDGPYTFPGLLPDRPGVWAVLDARDMPPVDAGESEDIRKEVETSERYDCWRERCDAITYAGIHVPDADRRREILQRVRETYDLPCHPD